MATFKWDWFLTSALTKHKSIKRKMWTLCKNIINGCSNLVYLNASRPAKSPVSVLGLGWLRKSFSISLAKDFCTSLQYGEWKTRKPKSSRLKCFSEPSVDEDELKHWKSGNYCLSCSVWYENFRMHFRKFAQKKTLQYYVF